MDKCVKVTLPEWEQDMDVFSYINYNWRQNRDESSRNYDNFEASV